MCVETLQSMPRPAPCSTHPLKKILFWVKLFLSTKDFFLGLTWRGGGGGGEWWGGGGEEGAAWQQSHGRARPPCDTMRYKRLSLLLCHTRARHHARVHVPFPAPSSFHLYQPPPPPRPSSSVSSSTTLSLLSPPYPGSERREAARRGQTAGCISTAPRSSGAKVSEGRKRTRTRICSTVFLSISFLPPLSPAQWHLHPQRWWFPPFPSLIQFYRASSTWRRGRAGKSIPSDSSERGELAREQVNQCVRSSGSPTGSNRKGGRESPENEPRRPALMLCRPPPPLLLLFLLCPLAPEVVKMRLVPVLVSHRLG